MFRIHCHLALMRHLVNTLYDVFTLAPPGERDTVVLGFFRYRYLNRKGSEAMFMLLTVHTVEHNVALDHYVPVVDGRRMC